METSLTNELMEIERGYRAAREYEQLKMVQGIKTQGDFNRYLETMPEHKHAEIRALVASGKAFIGRSKKTIDAIREEKISKVLWSEPAVIWATFVSTGQLPEPGHTLLRNFVEEVHQYIS